MPPKLLIRDRFETTVVVLLAALVALTPVSSKAINLAWILIFVFACWVLVTRALERGHVMHAAATVRAANALFAFFSFGLVLQLGMRWYWDEPLRGLSFEITALTAAGVAVVFGRHWRAGTWHRVALALGLTLASGFALFQGYGYMFKGEPGPTNAVNWGAGMALFMCIALPLVIERSTPTRGKLLAVTCLVLFTLAIFVGGRRGAFFAVFWSVAVGGFIYGRHAIRSGSWRGRTIGVLVLVIVVGLMSNLARGPMSASTDRVTNAIAEISGLLQRSPDSTASLTGSVGTRVHMLELGLNATSGSAIFGLGAHGREQVIKRAELDIGAPLFHLHNEYLQAWVAYGVAGLVASACFPLGLFVAGILLRRGSPGASVALVGLGLVHLVSGLSNVNTFHNFYTSVFAVCVVLPSLIFRPQTPDDRSFGT